MPLGGILPHFTTHTDSISWHSPSELGTGMALRNKGLLGVGCACGPIISEAQPNSFVQVQDNVRDAGGIEYPCTSECVRVRMRRKDYLLLNTSQTTE
jgi:hypothetical protein